MLKIHCPKDEHGTTPLLSAIRGAITEEPEDDLPRTVLADWLAEQGNYSLARFMHYQLEGGDWPLVVPGLQRKSVGAAMAALEPLGLDRDIEQLAWLG